MRLILASSSPRRKDLLASFGKSFIIDVPDVDESLLPGEEASAHVRRLALDKARTVVKRHDGGLVVAADTVVVLDGLIIGKPEDEADARRMLGTLSGRSHQVYTGVAVADAAAGTAASRVACSLVTIASIGEEEIARYVATGEPLDKAGSYAVQGLGGKYVSRVNGSLSNVIGLPLEELRELFLSSGWAAPFPEVPPRENS
jgi:septum formation protein